MDGVRRPLGGFLGGLDSGDEDPIVSLGFSQSTSSVLKMVEFKDRVQRKQSLKVSKCVISAASCVVGVSGC